jgi:hypothetical protein
MWTMCRKKSSTPHRYLGALERLNLILCEWLKLSPKIVVWRIAGQGPVAGRVHLSGKDLEQIVIVPGCLLALGPEAPFG